MTYNFDPYQWYDNEREVLELLRKTGRLSRDDCVRALDALEKRFHAMLERLDGTYQLPES